MKNNVFNFLKENIGGRIYIGGITIGYNIEILEDVIIEKDILSINNNHIDLSKYIHICFLNKDIIALNKKEGEKILISVL